LDAKDFALKDEDFGFYRKGKREYLKEDKNRAFIKELNKYFTSTVEVPRIRRGKKQKIETLINEEALLFAKYLREEIPTWNPRIADFNLNRKMTYQINPLSKPKRMVVTVPNPAKQMRRPKS
jgi:hypothetical protein